MAEENQKEPAGPDKEGQLPQQDLRDDIRSKLMSELGKARQFPETKQKLSIWERIKQMLTGRVSLKDVASFSRQLSMLIDVGIPLIRALNILAKRTPKQSMRRVIAQIGETVESGAPLSEGLAKFPYHFSRYYISSIKAGETTGTLGTALRLLADYQEDEKEMKRKFQSAMVLPVATIIAAIAVLGILMVRVVPEFQKVYANSEVELPGVTQFLINITNFIVNYYFILIPLLVILIILFLLFRLTPVYADFSDRLKLKIPVLSYIHRSGIAYRFSRLMSMMLKSGVPIHEAFRIMEDGVGNAVVSDALRNANRFISEGNTIEYSLRKNKVFSEFIIDIIGVGEETGAVDEVLNKMASNLEDDLKALYDNLAVLLEPIMLLLVGGLVLILALALFLPYYAIGPALLNPGYRRF